MAPDSPTGAPADRFPDSASKPTFPLLLTAGFLAVLAGSLYVSQADPLKLVEGDTLGNIARFLRGGFPPKLSWDFLRQLAGPTVETIQISVMGTCIAVLIGLPLGLLATSSLSWSGILHERRSRVGRWALGFVP